MFCWISDLYFPYILLGEKACHEPHRLKIILMKVLPLALHTGLGNNLKMQIVVKHNRWVVISASILILLATLSCQLLNNPKLGFTPNAMPRGQVGVFYFVIIKITNNQTPAGEFTISQGDLPKGLIFKRLTGQDAVLISGTPQEPGAFHFVLNVWCYGTNHSGQTGTKDYVISIRP